MKVYEIIELGIYDSIPELHTELFLVKEDAVSSMYARIEDAKNNAVERFGKNGIDEESSENGYYVGKEYEAIDWSCAIYLKEFEL